MSSTAADSRTKRLLDLVVLLLDVKRPVTFTELREQFTEYRTAKPEAGMRAFERDKATLVELGVPVRWVTPEEGGADVPAEGGYLIDKQKYRMPEVTLTPDEVAALVVTASAARHQPEFPYRHAAEMAVRKLMFDLAGLGKRRRGRPQAQPSAVTEELAAAQREVLVHLPASYRTLSTRTTLADHLAVLEEAVRLRKRVTIHYDHHRRQAENGGLASSLPSDAVPQPLDAQGSDRHQQTTGSNPRDVDPYGLVYRQGAWLLVGLCHSAGAVRRFRVDRILDLKVAPRPKTPDFEVPGEFSLQEHGSFSPWRFEREPPVQARLWVSAETPWVAEEDFGPTATRSGPTMDGDTEGVVVEFRCGNLEYLQSRVLGAAGALRLLTPLPLRRRIAEAAATVARRNQAATATAERGDA